MAWNEAICRPKAKRPSAYSRAMSSAACAPPICSKATSTAARSSSRSTSGQPWPAAPRGSAAAPSSAIARVRAGRVHGGEARARDAGAGEVHAGRGRRGRSPCAARTIAKSATSPSITGTLVAGQAGAVGARRQVGRRRHLRALGQREAADRLALRDAREPALLLRVAARDAQRLGGQVDRGGERGGGEAPAQLLRDHAELEVAEAGAAVGLGDGGAHPAHLAHALPELARRRARRPPGCGGRGSRRRARRGTSAPAPGAISGRPRSRSSWREDHTKGACHAGACLSESGLSHPSPCPLP